MEHLTALLGYVDLSIEYGVIVFMSLLKRGQFVQTYTQSPSIDLVKIY